MSITIGYCSDLHVDTYRKTSYGEQYIINLLSNQKYDALIIAGDISNSVETTCAFLSSLAKKIKNVCYVDGNHDHYDVWGRQFSDKSVKKNINLLKNASTENNWKYLHNKPFKIDDTLIIGTNNWYDWNIKDYNHSVCKAAWLNYMNDSRCIKFDKSKDGIDEPDSLAKKASLYLKKELIRANKDKTVKNIVVATHTIPIHAALTYTDNYAWNCLGGSFYNSTSEIEIVNNEELRKKIKYWIFGHTHFSWNINYNGVDFLCNPRGYPNEVETPFAVKTIKIS